jgi:hypothetical protein
MSALNNSLLLGQEGGGGYAISRSLRFSSADSSFLSRTPASAGNRKTWTWAGWVKRSRISTASTFPNIWSAGSTTNSVTCRFLADDTFNIRLYGSTELRTTTQVFRDVSSWYHFVITFDTTQATASDRLKLYVNGVQVTAFNTSNDVSQNFDADTNNTQAHYIGQVGTGSAAHMFDGYLADVHLVDGQALDPTSFGEFDDNGIWQPIAYSGTYGTNGFHLPFSDNSSAAALGYDAAGSNDWTVNNLSVTAGAGNDSLVDVPTNGSEVDTGSGGQVRGNYCTWNPLDTSYRTAVAAFTISNGNLDITNGSTGYGGVIGTVAAYAGKFYWEITVSGTVQVNDYIGLASTDSASGAKAVPNPGGFDGFCGYNSSGTRIENTTYGYTGTAYGASWTSGDVIGVAFDADNSQVTFYKNGVSQGLITTGIVASRGWYPYVGDYRNAPSFNCSANFGQRPFAYPVSGFKALNTANLPSPLVTKPSTVMDVLTWTGTGVARSITTPFSPDFVWIKQRNSANNHVLFDVVRTATKGLHSDLTDAEFTDAATLTAFNSDGFSIGTHPTVNTNTSTYVGWTWDAGSSTVTNTAGSITSQVRANASAGFSIVTYTSPGLSNPNTGTVGHGLGVKPALIIHKLRSGTDPWPVYHSSAGVSATPELLYLNTTAARGADGSVVPAQPTSSVFSVGWSNQTGGTLGNTFVAYCFAPVAGYSSFGSYTGNGSADGPFVYTGFRPKFVLLKDISSSSYNWQIHDSVRNPYNEVSNRLEPNTSTAENAASGIRDYLSNGFKIRTTGAAVNTNGSTYIYAAFAESCFALNNRAR